jgi:hypothetical protein
MIKEEGRGSFALILTPSRQEIQRDSNSDVCVCSCVCLSFVPFGVCWVNVKSCLGICVVGSNEHRKEILV